MEDFSALDQLFKSGSKTNASEDESNSNDDNLSAYKYAFSQPGKNAMFQVFS